MRYLDNIDLLLQTFKIWKSWRCTKITVSIKDCQAFSQGIKEFLKYQISFVKCSVPQTQRTTEQSISRTQKKSPYVQRFLLWLISLETVLDNVFSCCKTFLYVLFSLLLERKKGHFISNNLIQSKALIWK